MKIQFSTKAKADLLHIAIFIAQDNPDRAFSFTNELEQKCLSIGDMPKAFQIVDELAELGIRRRIYQSYSIFFTIESESIFIIRVLNSAVDYATLFEQKSCE